MKEFFTGDICVYDFEGSGKPLLFVHAFPFDHNMWKKQVNHFSTDYHVITFDIRGFGKSKDSFNYIYTMEDFADDVLNIIEHLGLKNINICGLSMGGYIVQRAVIKYQDKFSSMILSDTKAERDDSEDVIKRAKYIRNLKKYGTAGEADKFMKRLMYKDNYGNKTLYKFIEDIINQQSSDAMCGASLAMATRTNTLDYFENINIPTLILIGDNDSFTPIRYSQSMQSKLRNSELKIIPNSGHLSPLENPGAVNSYLSDFLERKV